MGGAVVSLGETVNYSRVRAALLMALVVVLHFLAVRQVEVATVRPDLLLLVSITAGALLGLRVGVLVAFVSGICADLLTSVAFGTSAVAYLTAAIIASVLARNVSRTPAMQMLVAFVGSAFGTIAFALVATISGSVHATLPRTLWVAAVVGVINAFLAPVAAKLLAPDSEAARQLTFSQSQVTRNLFGDVGGARK